MVVALNVAVITCLFAASYFMVSAGTWLFNETYIRWWPK